ncbi:MAG: hypothetical protein Q8R02_00120 [Hyphomonadaceae bacterium]|nr:hypothetical protein [Hyphomonadaceae bacterium]
MPRLIIAAAVSALFAVACTPATDTPAAPAGETPPATEPAPAPAEAATPAPDARVGTMNLMCGGESFRVAFTDTAATVVNADGSNTDLPLLAPDTNAAPGVSTYTNGTMTFAKSGGGDTPTVIRFARGRMAFQDCAIAQN